MSYRIGGWQFAQFSAVALSDAEKLRAQIGWHDSCKFALEHNFKKT